MRALALLILLAGCPPPPPVPVEPVIGPDGCLELTSDAAVHLNQTLRVRARADQMKPLPSPPDFNFDGRPDLVFRQVDDRDDPTWWWHVLYLRTARCPLFVGVLQASQILCMDTQANGMCDLDFVVQKGAIHQHLQFDGRVYRR